MTQSTSLIEKPITFGWSAARLKGVSLCLALAATCLVMAATRGLIPASALPAIPRWVVAGFPHANAALSVATICLIVRAVRAARSGRLDVHRRSMLAAVVLFGTFLSMYLYKVIATGPTRFQLGETLERYVYLPVLSLHVTAAVTTLPWLFHTLLTALARPRGTMPSSSHRKGGRVAAILWLASLVLGLSIYVLLYIAPALA